MKTLIDSLKEKINQRDKNELKRTSKTYSRSIDFFSNDYLGLAKNEELHYKILNHWIKNPQLLQGSTGSRLISGNSEYIVQTEKYIAREHNVESALLFPSGYNANLALFSSILQKNDLILVDENIHRSIYDGCKLSFAKKWKFKHNDIIHLEKLLQKSSEKCFIAVESLYSMDGDFAPIEELCVLAKKYNAGLIVDEAHAFGVLGYGIIHQKKLQNKIFATIVTYGKALGIHGAAILGNKELIEYLINFASPFIYSTAQPNTQVSSIKISYEYLKNRPYLSQKLNENIQYFKSKCNRISSDYRSPIQIIELNNKEDYKQIQNDFIQQNIQTFTVLPPTVKKERIRICIHAYNTKKEIDKLCKIINEYV